MTARHALGGVGAQRAGPWGVAGTCNPKRDRSGRTSRVVGGRVAFVARPGSGRQPALGTEEPAIPRPVALLVVNALTVLRLALAVAYPFVAQPERLPVVVVAAASDLLDGVIARRFSGGSWIGGLLDAVADKLFLGVVLATAVVDGALDPRWLPALLARDVVVLAIAVYVAARGRWDAFRRMPSRPLGKATTAVLFALFVVLVIVPGPSALGAALALAGGATSMLAGADYAARFRTALRAERDR